MMVGELNEVQVGIFDELLAESIPLVAIQFFHVFTRFECALKRSGEYARGNDQWVTPRWTQFAEDLGKEFLQDGVASGVAETLIAFPPSKQILLQGGSWAGRPAHQSNPPVI
ncbi:hypothetical protein [Burkholderia sp. 22PA0106]|uniref:hypothetical protein n=1 Tax=Burkholderia sp. 22PA0106 TaxID=3237371 RepID=UPI0039C0A6D0